MKFVRVAKYLNKGPKRTRQEILEIRKNELESAEIIKREELYNLSEFRKTYYGKSIIHILKLGLKQSVKPDTFKKIRDYTEKLQVRLNIKKIS